MEFEPLLETSGEFNLRSINLTHGEYPCHCLAQTMWYPEKSNLCMIRDVEEIRSIGLPDDHQKVSLFVVSSMLALRWIEGNIPSLNIESQRYRQWRRYMLLTTAGGLSCFRMLAKNSLHPWK